MTGRQRQVLREPEPEILGIVVALARRQARLDYAAAQALDRRETSEPPMTPPAPNGR